MSRTPSGNNIGYSDIDAALLERYPLVVNATPAGTWPDVDTAPPFPVHLLRPANICFDMVYNPSPSLWLRQSEDRGARIRSGLDMLYLQALAALEIWDGNLLNSL